jgi:hypothetical protein
MARPGIYSDLTYRKRPVRYGTLLQVAVVLSVLALLARLLFGSGPVELRDHLTGKCVAIELDGLYYACEGTKFQGQTMGSVSVEPGTTLADLKQRSGQK